jgi:hypothetical protein
MINSLEIISNFTHPADAYRNVLALVRAGSALDTVAVTITPASRHANRGSKTYKPRDALGRHEAAQNRW